MFTNRFKTRPASFSFFFSWEYNAPHRNSGEWKKDEWFLHYILGINGTPNPAMQYGTIIGDLVGTKDSPVSALTDIGTKEYKLTATIGGVPLIGYADGYNPKTKVLHENKTSDNPNRWTQATVDSHKQFDMYLLLLYLSKKIKPEEVTCFLNFIPVSRDGSGEYSCAGDYKQFATKRTMVDIMDYASYIKRTLKEMEAYVEELGIEPDDVVIR